MKKIIAGLGFLCFLFLSNPSDAQKIKLLSGDLDFLEGQTELMVEYVYDGMAVGKFDKEEDYIEKKVADYNKKEDGKGDEWLENWKADRTERFEPKFEELMNNYLDSKDVNVGQDNLDAPYTIILKTDFTEPGFNVGVMRKPAMIDVTITFVETQNPENEMAVISMKKVPGQGAMGYDFDTGFRLQEAYAKCGKSLAKFLLKKKAF